MKKCKKNIDFAYFASSTSPRRGALLHLVELLLEAHDRTLRRPRGRLPQPVDEEQPLSFSRLSFFL